MWALVVVALTATLPNLPARPKPIVKPRATAVRFWAFDVSGGAGSISSPVRAEHPYNASSLVVELETLGAWVAARLPRWLLLSGIGVATRELANRQVREFIVPEIVASGEAKPKAKQISQELRKSLDARVTKILSTGTYSPTEMLDKWVALEMAELKSTWRSVDDVRTCRELRSAHRRTARHSAAQRVPT